MRRNDDFFEDPSINPSTWKSQYIQFGEEEEGRIWKRESNKKHNTEVNFIDMFTRIFYAHRSLKCKKLFDLTVFFALLGSASVKAACKMLVKLTPGGARGGNWSWTLKHFYPNITENKLVVYNMTFWHDILTLSQNRNYCESRFI